MFISIVNIYLFSTYSDLSLLYIDNQHIFLQYHAAIFIVSGGKMDQPDYLPPQIHIESDSQVNTYQSFIQRLT